MIPPELENAVKMIKKMDREREEWRRENRDRNQYVKDAALEVGKILGIEYWIVPGPSLEREVEGKDITIEQLLEIAPTLSTIYGGLNGYAVFPANWVKEHSYGGILDYVPVHWGITYNETDNMGQVFGFDTAHVDSHEKPRTDPEWIKGQIEVMIRGVNMAHGVERQYLAGTTNKKRGYYAQKVYDCGEDRQPTMGMMINMLGGQV